MRIKRLAEEKKLDDFLPTIGGTLKGPLLLASDPTKDLQIATKQYVDNKASLIATNQDLLDLLNNKVNKSGDTMTGPLYLSDDPTEPLQIATKQYIDDLANQTVTVISIPTITGPNTVLVNTQNTWTVSAKSQLVNTRVIAFEVDWGDGSNKVIVDAVNEQAEITHTYYGDVNEEFIITVIAINDIGVKSDPKSKTITLTTNIKPSITSVSWDSNTFYQKQTYTMTINATDPEGGTLTYEVTSDNSNVTIQNTTLPNVKKITFPALAQDTNISFTITVRDDHNNTDSTIRNITVIGNKKPSIEGVTWSSPTLYENGTYTVTINASDPENDTLSYTVTCNDPSVVISSSSEPNVKQVKFPSSQTDKSYIFTYTVKDSLNAEDTYKETKIVKNNASPSITSITWSSNNLYEKQTYTMTINASDPEGGQLTYQVTCDNSSVTISSGSLPNTRVVTFPEVTSNTQVTFTITVTDSDGNKYTKQETIVILDNRASTISGVMWSNTVLNENSTYTVTISAFDPEGDSLTYSVSASYPGVSIYNTGSPNVKQVSFPSLSSDTNVTFTYTVTDSAGNSNTYTETKTIKNVNLRPTINSITWSSNNLYENSIYTVTIVASDPDGDPLTYSVSCNNPGVIISNTAQPNVKQITLPSVTSDTTVTFTYQVSDGTSTTTQTENKVIKDNLNILTAANDAEGLVYNEKTLKCIAKDKSGNFFVAGYIDRSGTNETYIDISKFDSQLSFVKAVRYHASYRVPTDIAIDSNNNIYLIGSPSFGSGHFIHKYDNNLNLINYKYHLSSSGSTSGYTLNVYYNKCAIDSSNNIYIVGTCVEYIDGIYYYYLYMVKYDSDLNVIKSAIINIGNATTGYLSLDGITIDTSGNLYVCGNIDNNYYIGKFNTNFNPIKQITIVKQQLYSNSNRVSGLYGITLDQYGNIYVTGTNYNPNNSKNSIYVGKFDNNLNAIKHIVFNDPNTDHDYDYGFNIGLDGSGNIYVAGIHGKSNSTIKNFITKLDNNLNIIKSITIHGTTYDSGEFKDLYVDSSGMVYAAGFGYINFSNFLITKINLDIIPVGTTSITGSGTFIIETVNFTTNTNFLQINNQSWTVSDKYFTFNTTTESPTNVTYSIYRITFS